MKTLRKRIEKKRAFIIEHLYRQDRLKDPLDKDGVSRTVIAQERQSVTDLENRIIAIRLAIADANARESVTIDGETRTIADWLVWRREVAPDAKGFLSRVQQQIHGIRQEVMKKGLTIAAGEAQTADDVHINVDERGIANEVDALETKLGALDGLLSLKNATVLINV